MHSGPAGPVEELVGSYEWADDHGGVHKIWLRRVAGGLQTWYRRPQPKEGPGYQAIAGALPLVVPLEVWTWLAMRIWEEAARAEKAAA